jgi:hypothetical protein
LPHIQHKNEVHGKFEEAHVTKLWVDHHVENHEWIYQAHVLTKDGHKHEHKFTVVYEVKGEHAGTIKILEIHEGFNTNFFDHHHHKH